MARIWLSCKRSKTFLISSLTNLFYSSSAFCKRRGILEQHIKPIKSHVQLSESEFLKTKQELALMTAKVLQANLEGVVLKSPTGTYQPGKRNWLKVKKDYLFGGKMADTADLVVLGAWYGSGKKGGVLSIFLMGCYDARDRLWKTVTKVHSGLDDATNDEIHAELMKLTDRADPNKIPNWLLCKKALIPDVLAKEPKQMPVWEITGAEFTQSEAHTAAGISIRFPRITRLRSDKSAEQANDLEHLEQLYASSKKSVNVDLLLATGNDGSEEQVKKEKTPSKRAKNEADGEGSNSAKKVPKLETKAQPKLLDFFKPKAQKAETSLKQGKVKKEEKETSELEIDKVDKVKEKRESRSTSGLSVQTSQSKIANDAVKSEISEKTLKTKDKKDSRSSSGLRDETTQPKVEKDVTVKMETSTETSKEKEKKGSRSSSGLTNEIEKTNVKAATSPAGVKVKKEGSKLFNGLVAYFADEVSMTAIMDEFVRHGGTLTRDKKKALLVFHNKAKEVEIKQLRYV